ncbi:MAG: cellulase family glycosylhydrolase [Nitrosomonadaceae bacterium]
MSTRPLLNLSSIVVVFILFFGLVLKVEAQTSNELQLAAITSQLESITVLLQGPLSTIIGSNQIATDHISPLVSCAGRTDDELVKLQKATLLPATTKSPRGRVRLENNTIVTDDGQILRGTHGNSRQSQSLAWYTTMRDQYGINTIRLDTRISSRPTNASYPDSTAYLLDINPIFSKVDTAVDRAEQSGMYLILANFTSCCGTYNTELNKIFWEEATARYKDRKHVIYELQNEPVGSANYDAGDIAFEEEMYHFIRNRAPNTHIILWSVMNGTKASLPGIINQAPTINYSNASVGIHPYWHNRDDANWTNTNKLRSLYPVINTEFSIDVKKLSKVDVEKVWTYSENTKMSWVFLDLRNGGNYGDGVLHSCDWLFNWPAPNASGNTPSRPEPPILITPTTSNSTIRIEGGSQSGGFDCWNTRDGEGGAPNSAVGARGLASAT